MPAPEVPRSVGATMKADLYFGERSGVDVRAYGDGLRIAGWYDGIVGIEGGFLTWADIDVLRKQARRRNPYRPLGAPQDGAR